MKKMMTALVALFAFVASANAMSYEQARQQALFLTDKMAYELNLTEEQYEAAYEVNLDYLMGVNTQDDLYGIYWERRNLDLSYILLDWQYRMYLDATYFYRPLYWSAGYWHFGIYARYPHRDYFFFGRPHFYAVYRGGHAWHMNGGRSWYHGRTFAPAGRSRNEHFGMHNSFERGDYGRGNRGMDNRNNRGYNNNRPGNDNRGFGSRGNNRPNDNRSFDQNNRGQRNVGPSAQGRPGNVQQGRPSQPGYSNQNGNFGSSRQSSTRTTVGRQLNGSNRSESTTPRSTFTPSQKPATQSASPSRSVNSRPERSSTVNRSNAAPTRSYSTPSRSNSSSMSRPSTPSRSISSGSRGGSSHSSMSSGSRGGSHGGGSHGGGGGHFGGRR